MPKKLFDISRPASKPASAERPVLESERKIWWGVKPGESGRPKKSFWILLAGIGSVLLVLLVVAGVLLYRSAASSFLSITDNFKQAAENIKNFEFARANDAFNKANGEIGNLKLDSRFLNFASIGQVGDAINILALFGERAVNAGGDLMELSSHAFGWAVNQEGDKLIGKLDSLQGSLQQLALLTSRLQEEAASLNFSVDQHYVDIGADLFNKARMLDAVSGWLKSPPPQHFLVLFQNSSEMRPGGGFIGSYADVTLNRGSLASIEVNDIYYPDGRLSAKIVPPRPLQSITARWGARDANWFFDFPLSAKKVIEFLEQSKIYKDHGVEFGGALAVNTDVLRDLLAVTGPIKLEKYKLELTADNVLPEIQREVESGEDKKIGYPKKILSVLTPVLFEKLGNLDDEHKQVLAASLARRIASKDLMAYFKDLAVEAYLRDAGVGGEMAVLPKDFSGDYLAVVNANIAGHKTDMFIKQNIKVTSFISSDGTVADDIVITRRHTGQDRTEWWYRLPNKDYMQVVVPAAAKLAGVGGITLKDVQPSVNYRTAGFAVDSDLAALEETLSPIKELGAESYRYGDKAIFAGWLTVAAGENKQAEWKYNLPGRFAPADGRSYEYIFEKQSGANTSLDIAVQAPDGYVWRESGDRVFHYFSDNPDGRLKLKATLVKR